MICDLISILVDTSFKKLSQVFCLIYTLRHHDLRIKTFWFQNYKETLYQRIPKQICDADVLFERDTQKKIDGKNRIITVKADVHSFFEHQPEIWQKF